MNKYNEKFNLKYDISSWSFCISDKAKFYKEKTVKFKRIYPKGTSFNSGNYNPIEFLYNGA